MKCKCVENNKYEIVGLCDIQEFTNKIDEFTDKSWIEVAISNKLFIPSDKPSMGNIIKIFIDAKITSTKLIDSPKSMQRNVEGLKLTGKSLLVEGNINQRILYTSSKHRENVLNSFKSQSIFSTSITIDEDADINNDKYNIYPCIEDVSVQVLDEKTLIQNVTLFLFAHRTSKLYPNEIFFVNDSDDELARIIFDTANNTLQVTSTGNTEDSTSNTIIKFTLYKSDGKTQKEEGTIIGNQNASQFVNSLNNKKFRYGDIINIEYFNDNNRVKITGIPIQGNDYTPRFDNNETFIVSKTGLVPYILPSKIISNNMSGEKIVEINFSKFDNKIKVFSTGNQESSGTAGISYFKLQLVDNTSVDIFEGIVNNRETAFNFKSKLEGKTYSVGNLIQITSRTANNIIVGYPDEGSIYTLQRGLQRFEITENGLRQLSNVYPNIIVLRTNLGSELATIRFSVTNRVLSVTRTNEMERGSSKAIIRVILYDSDGITSKDVGVIFGNRNAQAFVASLNLASFRYEDIIKIEFGVPNRLRIENYPIAGEEYIPNGSTISESFRIGINRLVKV